MHFLIAVRITFILQDWFYALRWVPSRFFGSRVQVNPTNEQHKLAYRAHRALHPNSPVSSEVCERNRRLTAHQYRKMYAKVIEATSAEEMNELLETLKY